jgi:hypothetical protein
MVSAVMAVLPEMKKIVLSSNALDINWASRLANSLSFESLSLYLTIVSTPLHYTHPPPSAQQMLFPQYYDETDQTDQILAPLGRSHIFCCRTFLALLNFEADALAFLKRLEARYLNDAVSNGQIAAAIFEYFALQYLFVLIWGLINKNISISICYYVILLIDGIISE